MLSTKLLPELRTAFLVNAFISDNRKFLRPRHDENQDGVAFRRLLHSKLEKFLLGKWQGVTRQLAALDEDANLARRLCLGRSDRGDDPLVLQPGHELFRVHNQLTNWSRHLRHRSSRRRH